MCFIVFLWSVYVFRDGYQDVFHISCGQCTSSKVGIRMFHISCDQCTSSKVGIRMHFTCLIVRSGSLPAGAWLCSVTQRPRTATCSVDGCGKPACPVSDCAANSECVRVRVPQQRT